MVKLLDGYSVEVDKVTGDKQTRAEPFSSQAEYGFVRYAIAKWNADWIDELTSFPNGAHDDQVDALVAAFDAAPPHVASVVTLRQPVPLPRQYEGNLQREPLPPLPGEGPPQGRRSAWEPGMGPPRKRYE
jgi:hypothetical protein